MPMFILKKMPHNFFEGSMGGFFGGMSPFGAFGAPGWGWDWMAPPASKDIQRSNGRWKIFEHDLDVPGTW